MTDYGHSPDVPDTIAIGGHGIVGCQQDEFLASRLRHEHAVERIAVQPGQQRHLACLWNSERQIVERLRRELRLERVRQSEFPKVSQRLTALTNTIFSGFLIRSAAVTKVRRGSKPPQENMSVQKKRNRPGSRIPNASATSSGS